MVYLEINKNNYNKGTPNLINRLNKNLQNKSNKEIINYISQLIVSNAGNINDMQKMQLESSASKMYSDKSKYVLLEQFITNSIKSAVWLQEKQKNKPLYLFISPAGVR